MLLLEVLMTFPASDRPDRCARCRQGCQLDSQRDLRAFGDKGRHPRRYSEHVISASEFIPTFNIWLSQSYVKDWRWSETQL